MTLPPTPQRFEALWKDNYSDVLAFVMRRIDDRDAAADIVSETFLIAWRRGTELPADTRPWLFGVARRVLANARRGHLRRRALIVRLQHHETQGMEAEDSLSPDSLADRVAEAFNTLAESDRDILRLVTWDELTPGEAAHVMGMSPARFSVRLHRAKQRLRAALGALETRRTPSDATPSIDILKEST